MKSIIQSDEKLTEYRKRKDSDLLKIENNLIYQLIEISTQLDDVSITNQVELLKNSHYHNTQYLTELQTVILSGLLENLNLSTPTIFLT